MISFSGEHIDTAAVKQEHSTPKKGKHNSDCDRMTLGYSIIIKLCATKNTFQMIVFLIYRNIGRELNLAVWQSTLKPPN